VTEVAAPLPLAALGRIMGVPEADWARLFALPNRLLGASDPEFQDASDGGTAPRGAGASIPPEIAARPTAHTAASQQRAGDEVFAYFADLIANRGEASRDDLIGVIVEAELDGERLNQIEILYFCLLLIVAGNETTRNAISGGLLALLEHPEQRERLVAEPALIPTAVEEILRWTSPVMYMGRLAARDTEIRGQAIRAGDRVLMWYPSANRDEEVFPDPYRFDVGRTPNEHLAFGIGEHFCLGAGLARLELRVMLEELLRRFPDLALTGAPEPLRSNFIGGIKHMPVRLAAG
jgi:cholest-4-en-3-one 26-monooxygenase